MSKICGTGCSQMQKHESYQQGYSSLKEYSDLKDSYMSSQADSHSQFNILSALSSPNTTQEISKIHRFKPARSVISQPISQPIRIQEDQHAGENPSKNSLKILSIFQLKSLQSTNSQRTSMIISEQRTKSKKLFVSLSKINQKANQQWLRSCSNKRNQNQQQVDMRKIASQCNSKVKISLYKDIISKKLSFQ